MVVGIYPMVADVLHAGHVIAIEEAKSMCDKLIVALHCNPVYKKPVQSVYERFMQLRAVKWVDEIIPYRDKDDIRQMLYSFPFDIYFLGSDYEGRDFENKDVLVQLNKKIIYLNRNHRFSSTALKARIVGNTIEESDKSISMEE